MVNDRPRTPRGFVLIMACTFCGDVCTCSPRPVSRAAVAEDPSHLWPATDAAWQDPGWRREISSKVKAHKKKRGIDDDDDTLFLGFEELAEPMLAEGIESASLPVAEEPPPPSRYQRIAIKRRQAQFDTGNLIVFPPPDVDLIQEALAEPIPQTPRILEATPEPDALTGQVYSAIELDTDFRQHDAVTADIELPLQAAAISAQFSCWFVDAVLALLGFAGFAVFALYGTGLSAASKPVILAGTALFGFFWTAYHCVFLLYSGSTPGMQAMGLGLCTFDDCVPGRLVRAKRAASLCLSLISLGMGFAWVLLDDDRLGWHDRISGTYLRDLA